MNIYKVHKKPKIIKKCPECGMLLPSWAVFCAYCGHCLRENTKEEQQEIFFYKAKHATLKHKRLITTMTLALIIIVALSNAIHNVIENTMATIPDIRESSTSEAFYMMVNAGFEHNEFNFQYKDKIVSTTDAVQSLEYYVEKTEPKIGTKVKKKEGVIISLKSYEEELKECVGLDIPSIEGKLERYRYSYKLIDERKDDVTGAYKTLRDDFKKQAKAISINKFDFENRVVYLDVYSLGNLISEQERLIQEEEAEKEAARMNQIRKKDDEALKKRQKYEELGSNPPYEGMDESLIDYTKWGYHDAEWDIETPTIGGSGGIDFVWMREYTWYDEATGEHTEATCYEEKVRSTGRNSYPHYYNSIVGNDPKFRKQNECRSGIEYVQRYYDEVMIRVLSQDEYQGCTADDIANIVWVETFEEWEHSIGGAVECHPVYSN